MSNQDTIQAPSDLRAKFTAHGPAHEDGSSTSTEYAPLSSVEVGEDAKGNVYVKSAKVYSYDPTDAAERAAAAFYHAKERLAKNEGGGVVHTDGVNYNHATAPKDAS